MSNEFIPIPCIGCKIEWQQNVEELKKRKVVYRGEKTTTNDYRATCPKCGAVNIVTLREEPDDA